MKLKKIVLPYSIKRQHDCDKIEKSKHTFLDLKSDFKTTICTFIFLENITIGYGYKNSAVKRLQILCCRE